jgi:PhnB protein
MPDVNPFAPGYPRVSPYLSIDEGQAAAAIDYYREVFGAAERMRMGGPDGRIGHAELTLGDAVIMISDSYAEMNILGPKAVGGTPVTISVYVEDVDATVAAAVAGGATVVREIEDQFYGDRSGQFVDPFGHRWSVATHIEDVAPDEMARRAAAMEPET